MDVTLRTNASDPRLAFCNIRQLDATSYECELQVRSNGFLIERPFWFEAPELTAFVEKLRTMNHTLAGEAQLRTRYEDNFVRLVVSPRGVVEVTGVSTEYSVPSQQLRFAFETDQTVLAPFAADLATLLTARAIQ